MPARPFIVAIDGPSGAGKGTVARAVAARLQLPHVDTGAMYRAVAWKASASGVDLQDEPAVAAIARAARFRLDEGVRIDDEDVTSVIRTPEIDAAAAIVARYPTVRAVLVERQRAYGTGAGVVMEGRDIGTVVFPDADVKVFLDAAPDERARRRAHDPAHAASRAGGGVDHVAEALALRDQADRTRTVSPLMQATGAVYIDTTGCSIPDVIDRVLQIIDGRR